MSRPYTSAVPADRDVKAALLEAGAALAAVATSIDVGHLDGPATGAWTLREGTVAHATRGLLTIESTVGAPVDPSSGRLESATAYFALAMSVPQVHAGIEQRARDAAAAVGDDPGGYVRAALERVTPVVVSTPPDREVQHLAGRLAFGDYLATRIVEDSPCTPPTSSSRSACPWRSPTRRRRSRATPSCRSSDGSTRSPWRARCRAAQARPATCWGDHDGDPSPLVRLFRLHSDPRVDADRLGVHVAVGEQFHAQAGELVGVAEPLGKEDPRAESSLELLGVGSGPVNGRVDETRQNAVRPHADDREVARQRQRQTDHSPLRGGVRDLADLPVLGGH